MRFSRSAASTSMSNCFYIVTDDVSFADYIIEQGIVEKDGVTWTYEKWNSGKAVCYTIVDIPKANDYVLQETFEYPFSLVSIRCVNATLATHGGNLSEVLTDNVKMSARESDIVVAVHRSNGTFENGTTKPVSVEIIGRWQ